MVRGGASFDRQLSGLSDRPVPPPSALQPTSPAFWESEGVDIWHKLKLAEAVTTLLPFLPPDERAAARRAVAGMWALLGVDAP